MSHVCTTLSDEALARYRAGARALVREGVPRDLALRRAYAAMLEACLPEGHAVRRYYRGRYLEEGWPIRD